MTFIYFSFIFRYTETTKNNDDGINNMLILTVYTTLSIFTFSQSIAKRKENIPCNHDLCHIHFTNKT